MSTTENRKVRVIFRKRVYFNNPYIIPITKTAKGWQTGQNLSEEKMLNPKLLTKEDIEEYPFVVNPTNHYRVSHLQWLDMSIPYSKAIYDLLLLSGDWAVGKQQYEENTGGFTGYLEDKLVEAQYKNRFRDERYEAESLVRDTPIADYRRIALMLNTLVKDFNANIDHMREDELKDAILEACETEPANVKMCYSKYNDGVEFDFFVLECVHYGVLSKRPNGDIFDGTEFIGSSVNDVRRYVSKKENEYRKNKWGKALSERKGIKVSMGDIGGNVQEKQMADAVKLALFDNNAEEAERVLTILKRYYPKNENIDSFEHHLSQLKGSPEADKKKDMGKKERSSSVPSQTEIENFKESLLLEDIETLHGKVNHRLSKYKPEECKDFWNDKDKLVEYMVGVKFNLLETT